MSQFCRFTLFLIFCFFYSVISSFGIVEITVPKQTKAKDIPEPVSVPYGVMIPELMPVAYAGGEFFKYDISYTGGLKVGEATIRIIHLQGEEYEVKIRISTKEGAIHWIYPIDDRFVVSISGLERLPTKLESWQKEGRDYRAHKVMEYDQETGIFTYTRKKDKPKEYKVEGKTHNEFSSFLASRIMVFEPGKSFLVPTFADKKRVEVLVQISEEEKLKKTLFGTVNTIKVMPIMKFKGLYDKKGDSIVWYTNDECRIPVKVNSKLAIGSLSAELVRYKNPVCELYPDVLKKKSKSIAQKKLENNQKAITKKE